LHSDEGERQYILTSDFDRLIEVTMWAIGMAESQLRRRIQRSTPTFTLF
jgi:hypothetical protein